MSKGLFFIEPQLPSLVEKPPEGDRWINEVKYDGYRSQIIIDQGAVIYKRHGLARESDDADVVATALVEAHQNGVTDKYELMRVVDIQAALRHTS